MITSVMMGLLGSILGFFVYYATALKLTPLQQIRVLRIHMLNTMALTFIFSIFIELTTGSKLLAVSLPILAILAFLIGSKYHSNQLDAAEGLITAVMSGSMGVMLNGMVSQFVMWLIEIALVTVEILLLISVYRDQGQG